MKTLPAPNKRILSSYLNRWETLENYTLQEKSLMMSDNHNYRLATIKITEK